MSVLERLISKNKEEWFNPEPSETEPATGVVNQQPPATPAPVPEAPVPPTQQPPPASPDNTEYLKSLGFSPEAIQSAASGYSPAQGGFIEQLYRSTMQNPGAPDENQLTKLRNQSAVVDALGLVAQLATAAAKGNVKERKLPETATGMGISAERDLRNVYRQLSEQYDKGLINARTEDQKVGYSEYLANKKAIMSALQNRYNNEAKLNLEGVKAENKAGDRETAHKYSMERDSKRNEFTATENEKKRSATRNNIIYSESQRNKRNKLTQDRIDARHTSGGPSKAGKKTKTVAYTVPAGSKGAEFDGVGYYKKREYTPEQYESLLTRAKSEITPEVKRGFGITGDPKLSDVEYLQLYARMHPELLEEPSSLAASIDINKIGGAPGLNEEYEDEYDTDDYLIQ
jgi:hypothetical protein